MEVCWPKLGVLATRVCFLWFLQRDVKCGSIGLHVRNIFEPKPCPWDIGIGE